MEFCNNIDISNDQINLHGQQHWENVYDLTRHIKAVMT